MLGRGIKTESSAMVERFGRDYINVWWEDTYGIVIGPSPYPSTLTQYTVQEREAIYIHGFSISATEDNEFYILWYNRDDGLHYIYVPFGSRGTYHFTSPIALNDSEPANQYGWGVAIAAKNACGALQLYQARLLLGKERITI